MNIVHPHFIDPATGEYDAGGEFEGFEEIFDADEQWLVSKPNDVWMDYVRYGDSAKGCDDEFTMFWMAQQPQLDKGTALLLFWALWDYFCVYHTDEAETDEEHGGPERVAALRALHRRWIENDFNPDTIGIGDGEIAIACRDYTPGPALYTKDGIEKSADPMFQTPEDMLKGVQGREQRALKDFVDVRLDDSAYQTPIPDAGRVRLYPTNLYAPYYDVLPEHLIYLPRPKPVKKKGLFSGLFR